MKRGGSKFNEKPGSEFSGNQHTKTTEWIRYHEIKQDVLLKVAEIIDQHGAQIAFPTRTLHIESAAKP